MSWNYQREESSSGNYKPIPEGRHRIRIASADKAVSNNGNDMLSLKFDVSGYSSYIFHNIVFLNDRPELTNRFLTQFFDAFKDIPEGDFNMDNWIGKVGAAEVKHEEWNGNINAKIRYFVKPKQAEELPSWEEPERKNGDSAKDSAKVETDADGFVKVPEEPMEDLPF